MAEKFIINAKNIYPNYIYTAILYINCDTKVTIICPKTGHGNFERVPYNFLKKKLGCPKCIKEQKDLENKAALIAQFITDATTIHYSKYDYSKADFITKKSKITIICKIPEHPEFSQTVSAHLYGAGCPKCAIIKNAKSKLKDINWFRQKAHEVHGEKYDYTNTIYIDSDTHLIIECRKTGHPPFSQKANNHLQGNGCSKCAIEESSLRHTMTKEEFLEKLSEEQKALYEYDKVIYISTHEKIKINCKKCVKVFLQTPANHIRCNGCPKCAKEKVALKQTFTTEQFVEKAKNVHPNKFTYDKVKYVNSQTYVIITCPTHGDYNQMPNSHLQGYGCNKCAIEINSQKQRFNTDDFVKKCLEIPGNSNKYDYTNTVYLTMGDKVKIFCKICSKHFEQYACNHLNKHFGCGSCAGNAILTNDEFISKAKYIHPDYRYDYSKTIYIRSNKPVEIKCNVSGLIFNQAPNSHLIGSGCPCCKPKYSKPQIQYLNFIQVSQPTIQHALNNGEHRIKHSRYFADGYISESNTVIEFHGCYWHGCKKCYNETDINKITKSSFADLNKKTEKKKQHCIDNGYIYTEIWGCQCNRAIKSVINLQRLYRKFKLAL